MSHTRVGTFTNGAPPALNAGNLNILDSQYDDAMADVQSQMGIVLAAGASYTQIQAACTSAATFGTKVTAAGAITTSSTLTVTSACDLSGLTITYTGTGTAVMVGSSTVIRRTTFRLPSVLYGAKPATGWVAGTVGVQTTNLSDCEIYLGNIQDHASGLICYGLSGEHAYNQYHVRGLNNNGVNLTLAADATGYVNGNNFYGGRYSHNSSEGTQVTGVYHVWLTNIASRPNGNNWYGASLESPNVVQYAVNVDAGQYNQWSGCRWEDTSGHGRFRWGALAIQNEINGGYSVDNITYTWVSGSGRNAIRSADRLILMGATTPTLQLENSSSSGSPALAIFNAATLASGTYNQLTDWSVALQGTGIRFKNKADTQDRLFIGSGSTGGQLSFGSGALAADATLARGGVGVIALGATNTFKTGQNVTGSRPSASAAGLGAQFYDTTLLIPIWSDGTNWKNAAGTVV